MKAGRNGRGNKPVELIARQPRQVSLRVSVDGHASVHRGLAVALQEPMIQTLRTVRGDVEFGWAGVSASRQGRLF